MPLTDTAIKNAKPQSKQVKMFDSGGLFLLISPAGGKWWRFKYRFEGKEKLLSLGVYPDTGLKEARRRRDEARELVAQGIDPGIQRKALKEAVLAECANSFEIVAREWHVMVSAQWVETHRRQILAYLERDVFPLIGGMSVDKIPPPRLLDVLRRLEARDAPNAARKVRQTCGQIFRYAIATGRAEYDPSASLKDALAPRSVRNFASIKEPAEVGVLLRDIDAYGGNMIVRAALRMAPYVFVRPSELSMAVWSEFNLENSEWRIPPARMKMKVQHIVPLARQVIELLRELKPFTGNSRYLFPSMRANSAPISNMTLLSALRRMGYTKEQMCVHGFRSMASTLLNEQGYNRDWIYT